MKLTKVLMNSRNLSKLLDSHSSSKLEQYSKFTPSPVSIKHFLEFSKNASIETSYLFMRKEIPVRLANIMKELELLPEELHRQSSCCIIQDLYVQSFKETLQFENEVNSDSIHAAFTSALANIRNRHRDVVPTMAEAVMQMKESSACLLPGVDSRIQYFLDRLYMSRISIHMLINQHTILFGDGLTGAAPQQAPQHAGIIDPACDAAMVVQDAFENAAFLCDQVYLQSPKLELKVVNSCNKSSVVQFLYVPAHLYHILFELFKNALRATVETHEDAPHLPDIQVLVVKSDSDITIKISDEGGGLPRSETDSLFEYMYTTAPTPLMGGSTPMAGLGYGLPISRLYARYFKGDLILNSADGYGTDATVYLRALATEASEMLPVYNKTSKDQYSPPRGMVSDWTDPTANLAMNDRQTNYKDSKAWTL